MSFFDDGDRAIIMELGDTATLTDGQEFFVVPGEGATSMVAVGQDGDVERIRPDGIIDSSDIGRLGLLEGDAGTYITLLGRQYKIVSITPLTDGFSGIELNEE